MKSETPGSPLIKKSVKEPPRNMANQGTEQSLNSMKGKQVASN